MRSYKQKKVNASCNFLFELIPKRWRIGVLEYRLKCRRHDCKAPILNHSSTTRFLYTGVIGKPQHTLFLVIVAFLYIP